MGDGPESAVCVSGLDSMRRRACGPGRQVGCAVQQEPQVPELHHCSRRVAGSLRARWEAGAAGPGRRHGDSGWRVLRLPLENPALGWRPRLRPPANRADRVGCHERRRQGPKQCTSPAGDQLILRDASLPPLPKQMPAEEDFSPFSKFYIFKSSKTNLQLGPVPGSRRCPETSRLSPVCAASGKATQSGLCCGAGPAGYLAPSCLH